MQTWICSFDWNTYLMSVLQEQQTWQMSHLVMGLGQFTFKSVSQFSHSVVSDSLRPYGLQHARPPCPSREFTCPPRVYPNSAPLSRWCHPIVSSSVVPFPSCLQSFPASGSFPMSQLFASSGQSVGVSASTSVPPVKQAKFDVIQIGLISMSKGRICPFGCKVYLVSPGSCVCEKKYRLLLFFSN